MSKADDILTQLKADRDAIKVARAADAAKSDELAKTVTALKEQIANSVSQDVLDQFQQVADDLKVLGTGEPEPATDPIPPTSPADPAPTPPADPSAPAAA